MLKSLHIARADIVGRNSYRRARTVLGRQSKALAGTDAAQALIIRLHSMIGAAVRLGRDDNFMILIVFHCVLHVKIIFKREQFYADFTITREI